MPVEQIVGFDLEPSEADLLVGSGRAVFTEPVELPAAVYLAADMLIDGRVYPAGAMLHVGGEVDAPQALGLLRGRIARGGGVATAAGGGIG